MLKDKIDALKEKLQNKTDGNNKRKIENLIVFIIILIVVIFAINYIWNGSNHTSKQNNETTGDKVLASDDGILETTAKSTANKNELEMKLENILSKISGVRKSSSFNYIFRNKQNSCNVR